MLTEDNFGGVRIETFVTIPKDPSLPIAHSTGLLDSKRKWWQIIQSFITKTPYIK